MDKTLKQIKQDARDLAGSWNGEDEQFDHEGRIYCEDDVNMADDIIEKCAELEELLDQFN